MRVDGAGTISSGHLPNPYGGPGDGGATGLHEGTQRVKFLTQVERLPRFRYISVLRTRPCLIATSTRGTTTSMELAAATLPYSMRATSTICTTAICTMFMGTMWMSTC